VSDLTRRKEIAAHVEFRRIPLLGEGVLLFTSTLPGEGTTFVTAHLAISRGMRYGKTKSILFLDLNCNHQGGLIFDVEWQPGVVEILMGGKKLQDCILPTGLNQLFVLPYGNPVVGFEPLEYMSAFCDLLSELRKRYFVFIDSEAVFTSGRGRFDPAEVACLADATYLVILTGKTPREVIVRSQADIGNAGGRIVGVIMNDHFVKPFRSQVAAYMDVLEKIPIIKYPVRYIRKRLGIY
jgi:Mrp family chromosome partitioning ATPase